MTTTSALRRGARDRCARGHRSGHRPPGFAGNRNDARTVHGFTWQASGAVTGTVTTDATDASPMGLNDDDDPTRTDVAYATRATEAERIDVTVTRAGGVTKALDCALGSHYAAGTTVSGNVPDWAKTPDGGSFTARLRVNCTAGGVVHHFDGAEHRLSSGKWSADPPTPDCVTVTRTGDRFAIDAAGCVVQDEIVSAKPGKQLSTSNVTADFTATLDRGAVDPRPLRLSRARGRAAASRRGPSP